MTVQLSASLIGLPSCAVVNIASQMHSAVTATLTPSDHPWFLPVFLNVTVTSSDFKPLAFSAKMKKSINITPVQPKMAYNISVIPCNSLGCNKDCPVEQYVHIINISSTQGITYSVYA